MAGNSERSKATRCLSRVAVLLGILLLAGRPVAAGQMSTDEPQQSWVAKQFQRFRTYPHLDRAYQLIRENRLEEARVELERYLTLAPADREARTNYLLLLYRLKQYGKVVGETSRLLQEKPEAMLYLNRALAREKLQDGPGALEDYRRAAQLSDVQPADKTFALQQATDLALILKKPEIALQALDTLGPSSSPYRYQLRRGMALDMAGQPKAAGQAFRLAARAAASPDERVRALQFEAESWKKAGDLTAARQALEDALRVVPDAPPLLRALADVTYRQKGYEDTVLHLKHALSLEERAADRELLVHALKASGRTSEAETELQSLLQSSTTETRFYLLKAELALEQKRLDTAKSALAQVLRQEPANFQALRLMARVCSQQGNRSESIRWMGRIPIPQRSTEDVQFLAGLYLSEGPASSAAWLYKKLLQSADRDDLRYGYLVQLAEAYKAAGQLENARKALQDATQIQSGFGTTESLVELLLKTGNEDQAIAELDRAVAQSLSPEQRARAGMLYATAHNREKAARQLTLALDGGLQAATAAQAHTQRAFINRGLGKLPEAREDFEAAAAFDATNAALWIGLGETCLALKDFTGAVSALTQARSLRDDAPMRLLLAQALEGTHEFERALGLYGDVLRDSDFDSARQVTCLKAMAGIESRLGRHTAAAQHRIQAHEKSQPPDWTLLAQALQSQITAEDWAGADSLAARLLSLSIPPEAAAETWEQRAHIALHLQRADLAADCLAKAIASGRDSWEIHQQYGIVLYELGRRQQALDSFLASMQRRETIPALIYAGRCARDLGRSDSALEYFERALADPVSLSESQNCEVRRETGYLYFAAANYRQAAQAWEKAAQCGADPLLAIKTAKAWRLAGEYPSAQKALGGPPDTGEPAAVRAEYFEELAAQLKVRRQTGEAIAALAKAAEIESQAERHYLLGRLYRESGDAGQAVLHLRTAVSMENANAEYRAALGYALLAQKNFSEAAVEFEEALRLQPDALALRKDLGYVYVRLSRNDDAARCFKQAVSSESQQLLAHSDIDPQVARREVGQLRQEVERLENRWDVTTFLAQSSDKRELPPAPPALGLGIIPSYAGTEVAYTPPGIGLRNERIFQVFGRFLTNLEPGTIKPDPESYTVGVGLRYKPLRAQNLFLSGERIFGLHDGAASNWLLRTMYSKDWGYGLKPGRGSWNYSLLYGDLGLYVEEPRLLIGYGEARQGVSFNLKDTLVITPHIIADGRFYRLNATADPYVEGGGGVSFKLFVRHGDYSLRRASFEVLLHYRAGRALNPEEDTFSGFAATAILAF